LNKKQATQIFANSPFQSNQDEGLMPKFKELLQRIEPQDLLTNQFHSLDFDNMRAEFLSIRVRIVAFVFAVLSPLWIPVDSLVMDNETFWPMVVLRLGFSGALLFLSFWGTHCSSLMAARVRLMLFLIVPGIFYVSSRLLLGGGLPEEGVLLGYSFLPFLLVALLTIYPLTLVEGISYCIVVTGFFVSSEAYFGTLFTVATMGDFWLLALLGLIALLVEMTQIHMLLRLYREATRDALTGLVNRRVLFRWLDKEIESKAEDAGVFSILLFDLDLFKRINDNYGHPTGDDVLKLFSLILKQKISNEDLVGRYGGEEFMVILPGKSNQQAQRIAENIRSACHDVGVRNPTGDGLVRFTTSSGVAQWDGSETAEELIARVDQGLYHAKASGRDLVAVAA